MTVGEETAGQAAGREALEAIGQVLAEKPEKNGKLLTKATSQLCIYRDSLIMAARSGGEGSQRDLEHANGVLSVVTATHFPLGPVPWEELSKAKDWLSDLLDRTERAGERS